MSAIVQPPPVEYPEDDGNPMSENTVQFRWIVTIQGNLDLLLRNDPNAFVAGDLLWYPVEGSAEVRQAPDVMVVFGRPKGDRGSYRQWEEGNVPPQVVFEVLSPGNRYGEMRRKFRFYERYGVQEYYVIDPDEEAVEVWVRSGDRLTEAAGPEFVSPLLGVRFAANGGLRLHYPDGRPFLSFVELGETADRERRRADQERQRADKLAAKLRELGVDPEGV
jgi:Uma2 family endonuclease